MKNAMMTTRWRWILGVSLAINLLVVGVLVGAMWRHASSDGARHGGRGGSYGMPYLRALPSEARQAFKAEMGQVGSHDRKGRYAIRLAQTQEMAALLRAEPFDVEAVAALLQSQRSGALSRQDKVQAAWLSVVGDMDSASRQAYATRLLERAKKGPRRKRRQKD